MGSADAGELARSLAWGVVVPRGVPVDGGVLHGCPGSPCVAAIGAFDGMHAGHRQLLDRARRDAASRGLPLVAVTFDPDPSGILGPEPQPALLSRDDRLRMLWSTGVDGILVLDFTAAVASLDYRRFMEIGRAHV